MSRHFLEHGYNKMDFKDIQDKLKNLRDRIKAEGRISEESEAELKAILDSTLLTADKEIKEIQNKITAQMTVRVGNDNHSLTLSEDQMRRLSIIEKTGTGSHVVH